MAIGKSQNTAVVEAGTRERILAAAITVMRTRGVSAATTRAIAETAGISESLIYRYFTNKLEVLRAAVREHVGSAFADSLRSMPDQVGRGTVSTNIERVVRNAVEYYSDLIPLLASLFSDHELLEWYRQSLRGHELGPQYRAVDLVGAYLAAEQRLGRIEAGISTLVSAQMILGACFHHVFFTLTIGADRLSFDVDELAVGIARSILPPKRKSSMGKARKTKSAR